VPSAWFFRPLICCFSLPVSSPAFYFAFPAIFFIVPFTWSLFISSLRKVNANLLQHSACPLRDFSEAGCGLRLDPARGVQFEEVQNDGSQCGRHGGAGVGDLASKGSSQLKPCETASAIASRSDLKWPFDLATTEPSLERQRQSQGRPGNSALWQRNSHSTATALDGNGSIPAGMAGTVPIARQRGIAGNLGSMSAKPGLAGSAQSPDRRRQ